MAIKNPLDLPEIREVLATFLTNDDLARCVRVSKNWHTLFVPYLWSKIDILPKYRQPPPSLETMQKYKDHVRHLTYQGKVPEGYQSLHFPALTTLVHILKAKNHAIEMAGNHSSLTHLKLINSTFNKIKWSPPAGLSNLTNLSLTRIAVDLQDKNTAWNLFSRLETLELCQSSISTLSEPMMGSCRIKDLRLEAVVGLTPEEQLKWIEHCTHLKRLTWHPTYDLTSSLTEDIAQLAAANTWSDLEEFHTSSFMATDRQASLIISGMRRVLGLTINFTQPFDLVKTALRPHFPWLKRLTNTRSCGTNSGFALEILKSCPQLEGLRMGPIQVRDILDDDSPWACERSLRYLGGGFNVDEGTEEASQRVLLERLSRFRNLVALNLMCEPPRSKSLDLRLESGLDQLATLTRLRVINVVHTGQEMTMNEVEWIIKHWKDLRRFNGALHYNDAKSREMTARLCEAGISTERWG